MRPAPSFSSASPMPEASCRSSQTRGPAIELDRLDKLLINRLQDGLDFVEEPYRAIAHEFGISQPELFDRLQRLLDAGILSRFGPMFDADKMAGRFCLCAMDVPEDRFDAVTEAVNRHEEVAHNYKRGHKLNMWFVIGSDRVEAIEEVAKRIEDETGLDVLLFPKEEEFFISLKIQVPV